MITKTSSPEHFLCNVAATGLTMFARNMRRNLLCKVVTFTNLSVPKQLFLKSTFYNNFGRDGRASKKRYPQTILKM